MHSFLEESTGASVPEFQVASWVDVHQTMLHLIKQFKASDLTSVLEAFPAAVLYHGCDTAWSAGSVVIIHRICQLDVGSESWCLLSYADARLLKCIPVVVAP